VQQHIALISTSKTTYPRIDAGRFEIIRKMQVL